MPLLWAPQRLESNLIFNLMSISKQSYPLSQDQSYQTSLSPCTVQSIISNSAHFTSSLITLSRPNTSFCILLAMNMTQTPLDSSFGPIYSISSRCALKHPNQTSSLQCAYDHKECGLFFIQTDSQLVDYWKKWLFQESYWHISWW